MRKSESGSIVYLEDSTTALDWPIGRRDVIGVSITQNRHPTLQKIFTYFGPEDPHNIPA